MSLYSVVAQKESFGQKLAACLICGLLSIAIPGDGGGIVNLKSFHRKHGAIGWKG
jgi:hypothetical protein